MNSVLLEIILDAADLSKMNISSRDEIEDPLSDALMDSKIAEVTGGGSGSGFVIIDVEIEDENNLADTLRIIRRILQKLSSPKSTLIKRSKPFEEIYHVYGD